MLPLRQVSLYCIISDEYSTILKKFAAFSPVLEFDKAENHRLKVIRNGNMTSLDDTTAGVMRSD